MKRYVLDDDDVPVETTDGTWSREFIRKDRMVARTELGETAISTVFLGLDHVHGSGPPVLYETMELGVDDGEQRRASTRAGALDQHEKMVGRLLANLGDREIAEVSHAWTYSMIETSGLNVPPGLVDLLNDVRSFASFKDAVAAFTADPLIKLDVATTCEILPVWCGLDDPHLWNLSCLAGLHSRGRAYYLARIVLDPVLDDEGDPDDEA